MRTKLLQLIFIFISIQLSCMAIGFEDAIFPELAVSSRALAMGIAYVAKADDASSVYYNPAGLGTVRNTHLHLSNFHFEFNKDWLRLGTGGKAADATANFAKAFDLEGFRQLLVDNRGKIMHSRFQILPNFTTRFFSIGYLLSIRNRATIGTAPTAQYEYASRRDHGPFVAFNLSLLGGVFKIGASGTVVMRKEIINTQDASLIWEERDAEVKKGTAAIVVLGTKLTLPVTFLPTFAAKINNASDKDFSSSATGGSPTKIEQTYDLAFSLTPQIGRSTRIHLEANWKDFTKAYQGVSNFRKLVFGLEFDFSRRVFIRFGYGDGWGSAGLGIKTQKLEFDLTTYAVDTTVASFRGKEDRRMVMGLSYGF